MTKLIANINDNNERPLNKAELDMYNRLKKSFKQIKFHQEGKIELKTIEEVLADIKNI